MNKKKLIDHHKPLAALLATSLLAILPAGLAQASSDWQQQAIDWRQDGKNHFITVRQQGIDLAIEHINSEGKVTSTSLLEAIDFAYESACLYRDSQGLLHVFTVGENGNGEQWLLDKKPQRVRRLALPPGAENCSVDDSTAMLYVNEPDAGLWAYPAAAEAELSRRAVDMVKPFGKLHSAGPVAAFNGGILVMDSEAGMVRSYGQSAKGWQAGATATLAVGDAERMQWHASRSTVAVFDDDSSAWQETAITLPASIARAELPVVSASIETAVVGHHGDAADDPAIWHHPVDAGKSRILGTDKKGALLVYDLAGKQLQNLPVGRINNVDLRSNISINNKNIDLAAATQRDRNSILLFNIDRQSGEVSVVGEIPTSLEEIYGICLYQPGKGEIHAFVNGKSGEFLQYRLDQQNNQWQGKLLRRFATQTQPEGCVVDDLQHRLFFGEEDQGIWTISARANTRDKDLQPVMMANDVLVADVEGMALYHARKTSYLIVSSQGNDSYVVLEARPPYRLYGAFRIGINIDKGIDGASETDGLDVSSANFGGSFANGLLVVQDGRNRMPEDTQNFKYISWQTIADTLNLE